MSNPYETPVAESPIIEKNIKGGYFTDGVANALDCLGAWISLERRYLRFKYVPAKSKNIVLVVFCVIIALSFPFAMMCGVILRGAGALALYVIVSAVITTKLISKVEFSLDEEELLVDEKNLTIGVRKTQNGEPVILGSKVPQYILDRIVQDFEYTRTTLKRGSRLMHWLIVFSVCFVVIFAGKLLNTHF